MGAAGIVAATATIALLGCTFPVDEFSADPSSEAGLLIEDPYAPHFDAAITVRVDSARAPTGDDDDHGKGKGKGHDR